MNVVTKGQWILVIRFRLREETEEFSDHILIYSIEKGVMDVSFINFWSKLGVVSYI